MKKIFSILNDIDKGENFDSTTFLNAVNKEAVKFFSNFFGENKQQ